MGSIQAMASGSQPFPGVRGHFCFEKAYFEKGEKHADGFDGNQDEPQPNSGTVIAFLIHGTQMPVTMVMD